MAKYQTVDNSRSCRLIMWITRQPLSTLLFLFLGVTTCHAQEIVELQSGEHYWQARFLGQITDVEESGDELVGKAYGMHGAQRFRIKKALVQDKLAKTKGAIGATQQLIGVMHANWDIEPLTRSYREKLHGLTEQRFLKPEEWSVWFKNNQDYLVWSEKAGHLIVDEEARKAGVPVDEYRKAHPLKE